MPPLNDRSNSESSGCNIEVDSWWVVVGKKERKHIQKAVSAPDNPHKKYGYVSLVLSMVRKYFLDAKNR